MAVDSIMAKFEHIRDAEVCERLERYAVDGVTPKVAIKPKSVEALSDILEVAFENDFKVIPFGAGTAIHIGNPPKGFDAAIDMTGLGKVVEFSPSDMVVTVEAGVRMQSLQALLNSHGLFLPVDPPQDDIATVGGVVATNAFGTMRFGYGAVRDWLIGLSVMQPNGKLTRFGGKVVKNVAGYDMVRLYAGSYGTLGVITHATFRLLPLPEHSAIATLLLKDTNCVEVMMRYIVLGELQPSTVMVLECDMSEIPQLANILKSAHEQHEMFLLFIGFDDFREAVNYQIDLLKTASVEHGATLANIADGEEAKGIRSILRSLQQAPNAKMHVRLTFNPTHFIRIREEVKNASNRFGIAKTKLISHPLDGILYASVAECPDDVAVKLAWHLVGVAESFCGNIFIERIPSHIKQLVPVWGRNVKTHSLMKRIKEELDERSIMSCGRFIDGI
jgi:glycolate oxidase FAD binding subunit